jgi:adenylate cyclase class IV
MTLEERRHLVIEDIVDEDQARRSLVKERLAARLVDFMVYLDEMEQLGAFIYLATTDLDDDASRDRDRKDFVEGYIDEMMEHEDDPIGELAYCNPSLES